MASFHQDGSSAKDEQSSLVQLLSDIRRDLLSQQGRLLPNINLALTAGESVLQGGLIDDRKYLVRPPLPASEFVQAHNSFHKQVEKVVQLAASLPNDTKIRADLNSRFIHRLWSSLQHPPISYLGDKFMYRSADGSGNVSHVVHVSEVVVP